VRTRRTPAGRAQAWGLRAWRSRTQRARCALPPRRGMRITAAAGGTDATRGTSTMGGIMHVDAPRPQNGAGAVAAGAPGAAGSGGSGAARAAKYNMATLEERTRFKPRCEVLMVEIKVRNHKGRQGAYSADDHARNSFLKRTALPGLRWGKVPVPGEHQRTLPDARRRVRSLSLLSLPRALCARSDQTVETVDWTKSWPPSP